MSSGSSLYGTRQPISQAIAAVARQSRRTDTAGVG
jgi:hypothetical protein